MNKYHKSVKLAVFLFWFFNLLVTGIQKSMGNSILGWLIFQYLISIFWYVYNLYRTSLFVNSNYPEIQKHYWSNAKWGKLKIVSSMIVNYQTNFSIEDVVLKEVINDLKMSIRLVIITFIGTILILLL